MTEHTPPDGRPRSSFAEAAAALSRLGRVRDLPVVLMLAWVGWLAIPWPFGGPVQARSAADQPLSAGVKPPGADVRPSAAGTGCPATDVRPPAVNVGSPADGRSPSLNVGSPAADGRSPSVDVGFPATDVGFPATDVGFPAASVAADRVPGDGDRVLDHGPSAVPATWALTAAPVRSALFVKPVRPPATDAESVTCPGPVDGTAQAPAGARNPSESQDPVGARNPSESRDPARTQVEAEAAEDHPDDGAARSSVSLRELVASERARIAGEVHDAAGHGLATIAMQAGIALLLLDEHPDQARESLEAIRSTSMLALDQLRSALDLIDPATPEHDLPRLIAGVRAAGLPVDVDPAEPNVPADLEGAVYRVVRESLTNVLRHAGPTRASVRIASGPHELVVEVADRGRGLHGAAGESPSGTAGVPLSGTDESRPAGRAEGRGLAGMRARVTEAGGSFGAGPREGGGFRVVARFPVGAA